MPPQTRSTFVAHLLILRHSASAVVNLKPGLIVIPLCALLLLGAVTPGRAELSVQVLMTTDARRAPSTEHVEQLVHDMAAQLGVSRDELPHILLVYASPKSASLFHLPADTKQFLQKVQTPEGIVFEVWIIGATGDEFTVLGIGAALNQRFELGLDTERLKQVTAIVCRKRRQTVSVDALRSGR